jgi:hypothetical protein
VSSARSELQSSRDQAWVGGGVPVPSALVVEILNSIVPTVKATFELNSIVQVCIFSIYQCQNQLWEV